MRTTGSVLFAFVYGALAAPAVALDLSGGGLALSGGSQEMGAEMTGAGGGNTFSGEVSAATACGTQGTRAGGAFTGQCGNVDFSLYDRSVTNTFATPANAALVTVPLNAVATDYDVFINLDPVSQPLRVIPATIVEANSKLLASLGSMAAPIPQGIVEINLVMDDNQFLDGNLGSEALLRLQYADADNDGLVDGTNPPIRARTLRLWRLDESRRLWVKVPGSTVDTLVKTVSAKLQHFSVYAMLGTPDTEVSNAFAYPIPWSPNSGKPGLGNKIDGIRFGNLPSEGTIRVFDLNGEPVRSLDIPAGGGGGTISWDVRNDGGSEVASGVYFWIIQAGQNRKTGKLMVVR